VECKVVNRLICGDHTLFIGEVVAASIDVDCIERDNIKMSAAKPIAQKNWIYYDMIRRASLSKL